jgi:hypothetical protein
VTCPGYAINVVGGGLRGEVLFNGWHAYRLETDEWRTCQVLVNPYVVEGPNTLLVKLTPSPDRGAVPEGKDVGVEVDLLLSPDGSPPAQEHLLYYKWTWDQAPLAEGELRTVLRHDVHLRKAFGRWQWERATPYLDRDGPAIVDLVIRAHRALATGDIDGFIDLMSVKIEELGRSIGRDPTEYREEQRRKLQSQREAEGWRVEPLDPNRIRMRSTADGRLVEVLLDDGGPPLRSGYELLPIRFSFLVSQSRGQWFIAR